MKRTALKRKSPLKSHGWGKTAPRKGLRRESRQPLPILKKKLWRVFADYIKKRDKNICFTCGQKCEGHNAHAGHFIAKSVGGIALYFHPDNVHAQCMRCNIWLGGHQWEYGQRLGPEKVAELYAIKNGPTQKWDAERYEFEIRWYTRLLSELQD